MQARLAGWTEVHDIYHTTPTEIRSGAERRHPCSIKIQEAGDRTDFLARFRSARWWLLHSQYPIGSSQITKPMSLVDEGHSRPVISFHAFRCRVVGQLLCFIDFTRPGRVLVGNTPIVGRKRGLLAQGLHNASMHLSWKIHTTRHSPGAGWYERANMVMTCRRN